MMPRRSKPSELTLVNASKSGATDTTAGQAKFQWWRELEVSRLTARRTVRDAVWRRVAAVVGNPALVPPASEAGLQVALDDLFEDGDACAGTRLLFRSEMEG